MIQQLFYSLEGAKLTSDYALRVLIRRLARLNIEVRPAENINQKPLLRLQLKGNGSEEAFSLRWFADTDAAKALDPQYCHTMESSLELHDLFRGDDTCRNTGVLEAEGMGGLLQGVLEFCENCERCGDLPIRYLDIFRKPKLWFRSGCLQLMKAGVYTIDISRKEFPWFYDRNWWTEYLDFLADSHFNAITLWNFYPFPYFSRIPGYEADCPVSPEQLEENNSLLHWLTNALRERNMTLNFQFYCIYVPIGFAKKIGMQNCRKFTAEQAPAVTEYIKTCVQTFTEEFRGTALTPCLAEGLSNESAEGVAADILIPAMLASGGESPLIVRQWQSLTTSNVKKKLMGRYPKLYVMLKHNAEHVASEAPDSRMKRWADLGIPCVVNMHMLSEVPPFRWAPTHFIHEICTYYHAMDLSGIHLYSQWPWRAPISCERDVQMQEYQRDRLFYEAFGRYSYDPIRDEDEEDRYWVDRFAGYYGGAEKARAAIKALNLAGRTFTRMQQAFWIHYDNHSVFSAGFRVQDYFAARTMNGRKTCLSEVGSDILPLKRELEEAPAAKKMVRVSQLLQQSILEADQAEHVLLQAGILPGDRDEAGRVLADMIGIKLVLHFHQVKLEAVKKLAAFLRLGQKEDLLQGSKLLRQSVTAYDVLNRYASDLYYGISDVFPVIPIRMWKDEVDIDSMPYGWKDIMPVFEEEARCTEQTVRALEDGADLQQCDEMLRQGLHLEQ